MKKHIVKFLALSLVLSSAVALSPAPMHVDVVSAATTNTSAPAAPAAPATQTSTPASVSTSASGNTYYTVVAGDVLWKIAQNHNLTLDQLLSLNPQIKNPNLIFVGDKVAVGKSAAAAAQAGKTVVYQGLGHTSVFRNGPGKDDTGVPVYSFSIALADATFDADGRILGVYIDGYEVATPNYDGASMPHFSGWPDTAGYNVTDHNTGKVTGVSTNTLDSATAEVNGWKTKRQRGDAYGMNPANEWYKQMDFYQKFFVGKTVDELETWFAKNTTAAGRPIKSDTTNADDLAKLAKLTEKEKAELVDVVAGATMSLRDPHGDFLGAVEDAYKNRVEVDIPTK